MSTLSDTMLLRSLFEGMDALAITGPDGSIAYTNAAFSSLTGYGAAEAEGKNLSYARAGAHGEDYFASLAARSIPGSVFTDTYIVSRKDGTTYWMEERVRPIFNEKGELSYFANTLRDVSPSKTAEKEAGAGCEYLSQIIATIADPIFVKDEKHAWILLNDAYCAFMGYPREKLLGKSDYDFFPKKEADVFWEKDEAVFRTGRENVNEENFTDSSGISHVIITKKRIFSDSRGKKVLVGTIRDITDLKRAQEDILASQAHLEKEVADRTRELRDSNAALEKNLEDLQSAQKALKASQENYRLLVESARDTIFVLTKEYVYEFMNAVGAEAMGLTPKEMISRPVFDFFPAESWERMKKEVDTVLASHEATLFENLLEIGGVRKWMSTWLIPIQDSKGEYSSVLGMTRDITRQKAVENELYSSRQMMALILNNIPQRIFWKDRESRYLGCNTAFARDAMLSSREQVVGKTDSDMPWSAQAGANAKDDAIVMETGISKLNYEEPQLGADGKVAIWMRMSKVPLQDAQGQIIGILGSYEDISGERQARVDARKFELALSGASDGIAILDESGKFIYVNSAIETISGYARGELIGSVPNLSRPKESRGIREEDILAQLVAKRQPYSIEVPLARKNGEEYIADVHAAPIFDEDGALTYVVCIVRDITQAKAIDRAKTEFVSLASHQLRTPLSIVNWYIGILQKQAKEVLPPKLADYLEEVARANVRMTDLVNALLSVSRVDLGTFPNNPEETNLAQVAESVLKELSPLVAEKGVAVESDMGMPGEGVLFMDRKIAWAILSNMISNAVKYTPKGGKVRISLHKTDTTVDIAVSDTGIGIPSTQKDKIFNKFFRADNARRREADGNGLGLYIIKAFIEKIGGSIRFNSEEDKGTTFYVSIPLQGKAQNS